MRLTRSAWALGAALLGCRPPPPLPRLHAAWRATPDDPGRRVRPPELPWRPSEGWAELRRGALSNGLTVYAVRRPVAEATLALASPGAGLLDAAHGRATLYAATVLLRRALERHPEGDGAPLSVETATSDQGALLSVRGPRRSVAYASALLRDVFLGVGLDLPTLARARDLAFRTRREGVGLVETMHIALRQQMFGEESLAARPSAGYSDEIESVRARDVQSALSRAFVTADSAVVVMSDMDLDAVVAALEPTLGRVPVAPRAPRLRPSTSSAPRAMPVTVVPFGGAQATLLIACPLGASTGDGVAQQALSALFGADLSSHFAEIVRNERGLSYAFDADVSRVGGQSVFTLRLTVDASRSDEAVDAVLSHFESLAREGLPAREAHEALTRLRQRRLALWDDASTVAAFVAADVLRGATPGAPTDDAPDPAVVAEVQRLAAGCAPDRLGIAMAGDPRVLAPVAERDDRPPPQTLFWRPTVEQR